MPGGVLELYAIGREDVSLIGNPQMSFFRTVYHRHTNFAIEPVIEKLHGTLDFGRKVHFKLPHRADLINECYLVIDLPDLVDSSGTHTFSWCNGIGHAIIEYIEIEIGGVIIDRHYGQYLDIRSELTTPVGKKNAMNNMVRKFPIFDASMNDGAYRLYVPLQFWFNKNVGSSLPVVGLQHSDIIFNIKLRKLEDIWIHNSDTTLIQNKCPNRCQIGEMYMLINYIYLGNAERKFFANPKKNGKCITLEYVIEQIQLETTGLGDNIDHYIPLTFRHPVKELIWVIQRPSVMAIGSDNGNEWFNYSDRQYNSTSGPGGGTTPKDNMISAELQLEGQYRFERMYAEYFRIIQPFERHTNVPENFIYCYSFALKPEELQPTGSLNFSVIDKAHLHIKTISGLSDPYIYIYAINYNWIEIADGQCRLRYK